MYQKQDNILCLQYNIYNYQSKHNKIFIALYFTICYTTTCFGPFLGHRQVVSA